MLVGFGSEEPMAGCLFVDADVGTKKPWSVGVLDVPESLPLSCDTDTLNGAMVVADGSTDEEACPDSEYAGGAGISDLVREI
jgi:hypothetical protein